MVKKESKEACKFYDKYRFFPDEKKKGIKILNKYIKELTGAINSSRRIIKDITLWEGEDIKHCKDKIREYEQLKEKLKKELKK